MRPIALAALLATVAGCAVYRGSGVEAEEIRPLDGFDSVHNTLFAHTTVTSGAEAHAVVVTCDDNLIDQLLTRVEGGELVITTEPMVNLQPRTDCTVEVELPSLVQVDNSGSGGIEATGATDLEVAHNSGSGHLLVDDIDSDHLEGRNSGSGGIELCGLAEEVDLDNTGSGGIDAECLTASSARVDNSASGSIHLTVFGEVEARVSGSGSIHLYGEPEIEEQSDSGSGDIVVHD